MADYTLDELAKAIGDSGIAKDVTLRRLVKTLGGTTTDLAKNLNLTGKEAKITKEKSLKN